MLTFENRVFYTKGYLNHNKPLFEAEIGGNYGNKYSCFVFLVVSNSDTN